MKHKIDESGPKMLRRVLSFAVAVPIIYVAAAQLGAPLPVPAWASDIQFVQAQLDDVDRRVVKQGLAANQGLIFQNTREQRAYTNEGQTVPSGLVREERFLEEERRELREQMRKLNSK